MSQFPKKVEYPFNKSWMTCFTKQHAINLKYIIWWRKYYYCYGGYVRHL